MRSGERGATYLLLLFALALAGAGLAAIGNAWAVAGQREREAELLFRGHEFAVALAGWRDATAPGQANAPLKLEDLLVDERASPPRHHLRRFYPDPFTGEPDWVVLLDERQRIVGLHSRVRQPARRRVGITLRDGADEADPRVGDWLFAAPAPPPPPALLRKPLP